MTAISRAKAVVEGISGKTLTNAKVAKIAKGYMNFSEGTNEQVAQLYLDYLHANHKSVVRSHHEQRQRALDDTAASDAGDTGVADL